MEALVLLNLKGLRDRPDKLDYHFFKYLGENSRHKIHLCEIDDEQAVQNILKNPSVIIIVFTCFPNYLHKYSNIKIYWIYDFSCSCNYGCDGTSKLCKFNPQEEYINETKFDYIWYKYESHITKRLKNKSPELFKKFPHMIFDPNIHKDYNLEKQYDILFYGGTYPEVYPFRNRMYYILKQNEDKFNVLFLPYTKKHPEKMITGVELNKKIGQSRLVCSCCLIQEVLVAKYYEIGLCGSVVLGDYPSLEDELYIKNNMIYINRHMSDSEIVLAIQTALDNKQLLDKYSNNTKEYLSANYMYKNGVEHFEKLIENINH